MDKLSANRSWLPALGTMLLVAACALPIRSINDCLTPQGCGGVYFETVPSLSQPNSCNLSSKTLTAWIRACPTGQSGRTCSLIPMKLVVRQGRIFYYDSPDEDVGTVFYPGKTVDALLDSAQNRRLLDRYMRSAVTRSASLPLTAKYDAESVTLQWSIRYRGRSPSVSDWSENGWRLSIRIPSCYTCDISHYEEYERVDGRPEIIIKSLNRQSCQIS